MSYLTESAESLQRQVIAGLGSEGFTFSPLTETFSQFLARALGTPTAYLRKSPGQMLVELHAAYGGSGASHLLMEYSQLLDLLNAQLAGGGGGGGGDPSFANVKLLLGFEGADAATTVTDESGSTRGAASVAGQAQIDTAQFKFGSASGLFDGTGDSFTFANSSDFRLSAANSDPFTIECHARPHAAANMTLMEFGNWGPNRLSWLLYITAAKQLSFQWTTNGSSFQSVAPSGTIMTLDAAFYHCAVDKDATGKIRVYVDGVMVNSATPADTAFYNNIADPIKIGSGINGDFNGWIDEVRITAGVARYASDAGFTAPTDAYPRS